MLPGGPHCVLAIRLTLALSRVLHGSLLGLSVASPTLARGLGWSFIPYLFSAGWGWYLGRLLSFASGSRLCPLSGGTSLRMWVLGGFLVLSFVLPWLWVCLQVHLTGSVPVCRLPFRLGAFSYGCGFRLCRSVLLAPWGCRCACCSLPETASQREFFALCLVLPLLGSVTFSRVCSSVGGPVGVAHSFHPSLLLGGSLVRLCGGLC